MGEFIQTKNSYINSTCIGDAPSFLIHVSPTPNYKNHANETTVYNCGSLKQYCRVTTVMCYGLCIMDKCNLTQNRVTKDLVGHFYDLVTSDSYVTCVNVVENNQSSGNFNCIETSHYYYTESKFKVKSCNYIRNKSPGDDSYLIYSYGDALMSYCCILKNEIKYIFKSDSMHLIFENSTTDSINSTNTPPTFKNTNISFEISCPVLTIYPTKENEENEEENNLINIYIKKPFNLTYMFAFLSSTCS